MSEQVLEGSWEEIVGHSDELSGKHVRLTVLDESPDRAARQLLIEDRPLEELLKSLTGVIDSREPSPAFASKESAWGDAVVEKFRRQGLRLR